MRVLTLPATWATFDKSWNLPGLQFSAQQKGDKGSAPDSNVGGRSFPHLQFNSDAFCLEITSDPTG